MSGVAVAAECALRRVTSRKARLAGTAGAVAVGIAGLVLVAVATTLAGDRALQRAIDQLPTEERAFTISTAPDLVPDAAGITALDDQIESRLRLHGLGTVLRTVEFRPLAATDGRDIRFAGIDDLRSAVRLIDGSWPQRCDALTCEVVAVVPEGGSAVAPFPADSGLGLTIVGTAVRTNPLVLSGQLRPNDDEVIALTDGVAQASAVPPLALFRRTYAWQIPVVSRGLRSVDVPPLAAGVRAAAQDGSVNGLDVSGPESRLQDIVARTRVTNNRLAVPVGALLVLFFGVAAVAGLGGRADHQRTAALLRRRGADSKAIACFRVLEGALPVVAGLVVGVAVALPIGGWLGRRAGLGARNVLQRSVDGSTISSLLLVVLAAFLLIVAVLGVRDPAPVGRRRRIVASDVAGVAGIVALAVLAGRGSVSAGSLNRDVDPALVAVPVLAAVVIAAVVIRVVPLVLKATSWASPRRWPLTKLTLSEATAQPLRSIATAALIAVTVMFSLLTFGYASTLRSSSRDQAAFAVPYDFKVQLGAALTRPQALAPTGGWSSLVPGTTATDVLRRGVAVRPSATNVQTVSLLGVQPATLEHVHGWRSSYGPPPGRLADAVDAEPPDALGTPVPPDAVSVEFTGTGLAGLHTSAVIARVDGTWHELTLDQELDGGVRTPLTDGDAGGRLIGFRLAQPADVSARVEHKTGEGDTDAASRPVDVTIERIAASGADGKAATIQLDPARLHSANGVVEPLAGGAVRITGTLLGTAILVTPTGPGQDTPLDAVMDPATARTATNGVVTAETSGGTIRLHPVAVVERFPGAGTRFAIVDIATLQPALDLLQPGAGTANELWLASDSGAHERALAAALDRPPFDRVEVDRRSTRQHDLATDPLAVVTLVILISSALVAVVLAVCAVLLGAAADSTDDRPLLRMLALERVRARKLVAMVAGKSLAVICLAIPLGLIGGRWLLQIATRLVAVTATSGNPDPPLRLTVPWMAVAGLSIALLALLGIGALAGAMSARRVPTEDLLRGTT